MPSLEEVKLYLRIDSDDEDKFLNSLISSSIIHCMDIARIEDKDEFEKYPNSKIAVLYTVAYFYEHREDADYNKLNLTLRALLFGIRSSEF